MRVWRRFAPAVMAATAMALGACGSDEGGESTASGGGGGGGGLPKLEQKETYKVGFAQTESNNPWRLAQTASMKEEAKERGWNLVYTDAGGDASKQVADVGSMISQQVDAIFLAPREEKPLVPAVKKARAAGIPVFLLDRSVDPKLAQAGEDYVTFIGSDFVEEGKRAAEWLINEMDGKAKIIELEGTTGSSPANDRKKGFHDAIDREPGMQVIASQDGDFERNKGRQVTQTLLQAHPDATAIYAHNDEMALGAIAAVKAAGKDPGKDITIVSVDGSRDALQAIIDGDLGATVECNPRFGPKAYDTLQAYAAGQPVPPKIINPDEFFSAKNAKQEIDTAY